MKSILRKLLEDHTWDCDCFWCKVYAAVLR